MRRLCVLGTAITFFLAGTNVFCQKLSAVEPLSPDFIGYRDPFVLGLFFGIMILYSIYNLMVYLSIGEFIYLGCIIFILCFSYALTKRLNIMRREQERQKERLIQADKLVSLGTMASSIVHEIANPNTEYRLIPTDYYISFETRIGY